VTVVAGVDGSANSYAAIRLAAQEAGYRQAPLIAVDGVQRQSRARAPGGQPVATLGTGADERAAAESSLREAVAGALGPQADQVQLRVMAGVPGRQLVEAAG
jgi:nucleotide-binding universal stress UspA family protein